MWDALCFVIFRPCYIYVLAAAVLTSLKQPFHALPGHLSPNGPFIHVLLVSKQPFDALLDSVSGQDLDDGDRLVLPDTIDPIHHLFVDGRYKILPHENAVVSCRQGD